MSPYVCKKYIVKGIIDHLDTEITVYQHKYKWKNGLTWYYIEHDGKFYVDDVKPVMVRSERELRPTHNLKEVINALKDFKHFLAEQALLNLPDSNSEDEV